MTDQAANNQPGERRKIRIRHAEDLSQREALGLPGQEEMLGHGLSSHPMYSAPDMMTSHIIVKEKYIGYDDISRNMRGTSWPTRPSGWR